MNIKEIWNGIKIYGIVKKAKAEVIEVNNSGKPWYTSMTIWANALMAVLTVIQPQVTSFVEAHPGASAVIAAVSNLLLRMRTDKPLQ
jgi:hypothetical protein